MLLCDLYKGFHARTGSIKLTDLSHVSPLVPPFLRSPSPLFPSCRIAGPYELRPSDILIERFQAWKRLVKNLIAYFEGIADIEVGPLLSPSLLSPSSLDSRQTDARYDA